MTIFYQKIASKCLKHVYQRHAITATSLTSRCCRRCPRRRFLSSSSASSSYDDDDVSYDNKQQQHHFHHHHHQPITTFTEDEEMIRDTVREWSNNELKPLVKEMDDKCQINPNIIQSLFDTGLMGMEIPETYGGSGLSFTSTILAVEEISKIDPSISILVDIHNTLTINAIRFWGSDTLKDKWLPRLASDTISSFCLSEASSGSDAFAMKTTAIPTTTTTDGGDEYVINGTKLWISNAREAGVFIVFANVNPELGYKGITAFVVDANTDGVSVGKPESKLGLRASSTCPVNFDNVIVTSDDILGEVGKGYLYCINILNEGRIGIGAQQLGIAKGCMDIVMPYLLERKQFNTPIASFQGMQHQYAQIATEIYAVETMLYNTCRLKEMSDSSSSTNKSSFVKEASMVKLYSSQIAEKTASKSIEWLGGIGFTKDLLIEKFYRDVKVGSIYEGTSNIQLQTIAKYIQEEYK